MYDMLSFLFQADLLSQCLFEVFFTKPASFIHDFPSRCCYDRSQADHFLSMLLLLLLLSSAYSVFLNIRFFPCFRIFHIFRILEYSTDRSQHCKLHRPAVGLGFRIPPHLQFASKKLLPQSFTYVKRKKKVYSTMAGRCHSGFGQPRYRSAREFRPHPPPP